MHFLVAELFPRAEHVRWSNGEPVIDTAKHTYYPDRPATGFQGFLHHEELNALSRHAYQSERVCVVKSRVPSIYC
jgi:hypothetical protein